jgi:hypothetical protein
MQTVLEPSPTAIAARQFFETLPEKIKTAIHAYAEEMDYPIESVIEIAIASFLDEDSVSFEDCKPLAASGVTSQT